MKPKPHLLIINDDGIHAPGIKHLWKTLVDDFDLTIVAPASEKSGMGIAITVREPLHIDRVFWEKETPAWKITGTPADCVRLGISVILKQKPDLIVSGINQGSNTGTTVLASGTVGAVIEGALRNVPGIAFSCEDFISPDFDNSIFEDDPDAFVLFAEREGVKLGLIQANPLDSSFLEQDLYTPHQQIDKFRINGFDPNKILYVSCFLMARQERSNLEAINLLFNKTIEQAKKMGKTQICYMEIVENENHPLRPAPYIPLEPWGDLQREFRSMNVTIDMSWPTLKAGGEVLDEVHQMAFYVMDIQ